MDEGSIVSTLVSMARKHWWLVIGPAVLAALIALSVSTADEPGFVAEVSMFVDGPNVVRYSTAPSPDDVIREAAAGRELGVRIADAAGFSGDDHSRLRLYSIGDAQTRLVVRFVDSDEARSRAVVESVAEEIIAYVRDMTEPDLELRRAQVANNELALEEIERRAADVYDEQGTWESSDIEFKLWNVRSSVIDARNMLRVLENLYHVDRPVTVEPESPVRQSIVVVAASGLFGLLLGVVLAAAREFSGRRRGGAGRGV